MDPTEESAETFESREDLVRLILEAGHTMPSEHQLERWRGEGLLAPVRQVQTRYHGSSVEFPIGTAKQIIEIQRLLKIKNSFDYVGWELWWSGFPVDDKWWKPKLKNIAENADKELDIVKDVLRKAEDNSDDLISYPTSIFDQQISLPTKGSFFSRIVRRVQPDEIGRLMRVLSEISIGSFHGFDDPNDQTPNSDQGIVISAFDIHDQNSFKPFQPSKANENDKHIIDGKRLELAKGLPAMLQAISQAFSNYKFADVIDFPVEEIEAARDDYRNGLQIAENLYESTSWVFGDRALGLRLINWIANHNSEASKSHSILLFALLKRVSADILPSSEISKMALKSNQLKAISFDLRKAASTNSRIGILLEPKAIKLALSNDGELMLHIKKLIKARQSI